MAFVKQGLRESNFKIHLGHIIISREGIKPNPDKIGAIQKYPIPRTTTEVEKLGLLTITKPLTPKKGQKNEIDQEYN